MPIVKLASEDQTQIDDCIKEIQFELFPKFVQLWSSHTQKNKCELCNRTIIMHGNWKICRLKCCFEAIYQRTVEFGKLITGCRQTPNINSYFCKNHQGEDLVFNTENGEKVCFHPNQIKITRKCKL